MERPDVIGQFFDSIERTKENKLMLILLSIS